MKNIISHPAVTVLMTVYNGFPYIKEAIDSILNQSYRDFEFLIIDDCSTDNSVEIIKSYCDSRIRLIKNEKNIGQTASLNKGIECAKGEYIARMDQDDISLPERLEKQMTLFQEKSQLDLLGSWAYQINSIGKIIKKFTPPTRNQDIIDYFVINNPFPHSSVVFRKESVQSISCYDESFQFVQDWDLWACMINGDMVFDIIPEELVKIRANMSGNSRKKNNQRIIQNEDLLVLKKVLSFSSLSNIKKSNCRFKIFLYRILILFKIRKNTLLYTIIIGLFNFIMLSKKY